MIYGHMTLNSRSTATLHGSYACSICGENFSETGSKQDSCDDHFGGHSWWVSCCPHCGAEEIFEGKIFLCKEGKATARKDHLNKRNGKIHIPKGSMYKWKFMKGYRVNEDTRKTEGYISYTKALLRG